MWSVASPVLANGKSTPLPFDGFRVGWLGYIASSVRVLLIFVNRYEFGLIGGKFVREKAVIGH